MAKEKTIVFLGAGSMASAMIAGLISNRLVAPDQIVATNVSNRKRLEELAERYHIHTTQDRKEAVSRADIVIFAMKPKDLKAAIEEIRPSLRVDEQLYVSVLAGIPTAYIERLLGAKASVIRTMPNTSASVGASATDDTYVSAGELLRTARASRPNSGKVRMRPAGHLRLSA